jgi:hypothetical protein
MGLPKLFDSRPIAGGQGERPLRDFGTSPTAGMFPTTTSQGRVECQQDLILEPLVLGGMDDILVSQRVVQLLEQPAGELDGEVLRRIIHRHTQTETGLKDIDIDLSSRPPALDREGQGLPFLLEPRRQLFQYFKHVQRSGYDFPDDGSEPIGDRFQPSACL